MQCASSTLSGPELTLPLLTPGPPARWAGPSTPPALAFICGFVARTLWQLVQQEGPGQWGQKEFTHRAVFPALLGLWPESLHGASVCASGNRSGARSTGKVFTKDE